MRQSIERRIRRGHRIIDEQGERDNQRAKRDALHVDMHQLHHRKHDCKCQRYRECNDQSRAHPEAYETHCQDNGDCLPKRRHELANGAFHRDGLISHQDWLYTDRQIGGR